MLCCVVLCWVMQEDAHSDELCCPRLKGLFCVIVCLGPHFVVFSYNFRRSYWSIPFIFCSYSASCCRLMYCSLSCFLSHLYIDVDDNLHLDIHLGGDQSVRRGRRNQEKQYEQDLVISLHYCRPCHIRQDAWWEKSREERRGYDKEGEEKSGEERR